MLILSMKREVVLTEDGSSSIFLPELNEHYHSSHGALQEARHVFIQNGFHYLNKEKLRVFEMGFGTGLNALLTLNEAKLSNRMVQYLGVEAFPVELEQIRRLNYPGLIDSDLHPDFMRMHEAEWDRTIEINPHFSLTKIQTDIRDFEHKDSLFDIVYFDAFGYRAQEEMWSTAILEKMHSLLDASGILVTYAARGQFKRDLKALGFEVEALPGPPGKREMTRAIKH